MNVESTLPVVIITSLLTLVGNALVGWFKQRVDLRKINSDVEIRIEEHRDNLTFQLLKAAKDEVAAARAEVALFRPLARHLAHFEEAINHIERLVAATDEREIGVARDAALKFLGRMRGMGNMQQMSVAAAAFYDDISKPDDRAK